MDYGMETIYKEYILDLYRNPKNKKMITGATHTAHKNNPTCGDEITVYIKVVDGKITDIGFEGVGCAISQASVSLLTESVKGRTLADAKAMKEQDAIEILGIDVGPNRTKCAVLGYKAFVEAINT